MSRRKHLIIGCGSAGLSALEQIRRINLEDEVKVVTAEDFPPYSPTLLPYLLSGKIDEARFPMRKENYFETMQATLARGKRVVRLLPDVKQVVYESGETESYDTLLIASGGEAIKPRIKGMDGSSFLGFHNIDDWRRLHTEITNGKRHIALLGGGLVGVEVAAGLIERGCRVAIVEKEPTLLSLYFDQEAEALIRGILSSHGIQILTGKEVVEVKRNSKGKIEIGMSHGDSLICDLLVTCVGVKPKIPFVTDSGIIVNHGILVDRTMSTNTEHVYAAGDVAESANFFTGKSGLSPTILNAIEQGGIAGSNMAGVETEYGGWISANVFHFFGNTAFSAGISMPAQSSFQTLEANYPEKAQFKRLVYNEERLVGAMFVNIDVDHGSILYLIRNRIGLGSYSQQLFERPQETGRWLLSQVERTGTVATKH